MYVPLSIDTCTLTHTCTGDKSVVRAPLLVPCATGMTLSLVLQAVRARRPHPSSASVVVWLRMDQKSALKCIATAGSLDLSLFMHSLKRNSHHGY